MTVQELINELQKMPKTAKVYTAAHDYSLGQGDSVFSVSNMNDYSKDDNDESNCARLCGTNSVVIGT